MSRRGAPSRGSKPTLRKRLEACRRLIDTHSEKALPALLELLDDREPDVRSEAALLAARLQDPATLHPLIARAINDPDPGVRKCATHALGELRNKRASPALIAILRNKSEDEDIRGQAAESLGHTRSKRGISPLIDALSDKSVEVRYYAAFGLSQIADTRALPELRRVAATDEGILDPWGPVSAEARDAIESIEWQSSRQERRRGNPESNDTVEPPGKT